MVCWVVNPSDPHAWKTEFEASLDYIHIKFQAHQDLVSTKKKEKKFQSGDEHGFSLKSDFFDHVLFSPLEIILEPGGGGTPL